MPNKRLYPVQNKELSKGFLKNPQIHQPYIFQRLIGTITITTPEGDK
jgi:hypothetical protein